MSATRLHRLTEKEARSASCVFRHKKGGLYRALFRAVTAPVQAETEHMLLCSAVHTDNLRVLSLRAHGSKIIAIDPEFEREETGIVYVSLCYGTVWFRRVDEFWSSEEVDGNVVDRFATVLTDGSPLTRALL